MIDVFISAPNYLQDPTLSPSSNPTLSPVTPAPAISPTKVPTDAPSAKPTDEPSYEPTPSPTKPAVSIFFCYNQKYYIATYYNFHFF